MSPRANCLHRAKDLSGCAIRRGGRVAVRRDAEGRSRLHRGV